MVKYLLKNRLNRQIVVDKSGNSKAEDLFVVPPLGISKVIVSTTELQYITENYGRVLIIKKSLEG